MSNVLVGERIRRLRKRLNVSVDKLAEYVGKDRATIYRYENGDIENLPANTLEKIALALKTTPEYLLGWKEDGEVEKMNDFYGDFQTGKEHDAEIERCKETAKQVIELLHDQGYSYRYAKVVLSRAQTEIERAVLRTKF